MLIDPLAIQFSPKRGYTTVPGDQLSVIEAWKVLLTSVGWTLLASPKAVAFVSYPLGLPVFIGTPGGGSHVVGCGPFITIGSLSFSLIGPGDTPAANTGCVFVQIGTSSLGTALNLASAITDSSDFNATAVFVSGSLYRIDLEAKTGGPAGNAINVIGDGRFGIGSGRTSGGGYKLESGDGASVYQCQLTYENNAFGNLLFAFTLNNSPAQYALQQAGDSISGPSVADYTIVANRHSFGLFHDPDSVSGAPYRACSLFAMAPFIPGPGDPTIADGEVFPVTSYAVFILGPGSFRNSCVWTGGQGVTTCLDSYAFSYSNAGGWPRLMAIRSAGAPLLTPAARGLVTGALVMMGKNVDSGAALIGKMWDCAVIHDNVGASIIQGQRFIPLSGQASAGGSLGVTLMMCVPPPAKKKTGIVSTVNSPPGKTSVFNGGGDDFSGLSAGDPITINGVPCVVDSVTDALALIISSAPFGSNLTSVSYTVP